MTPRYSIIVPVYNRPQELAELLDSLVSQTVNNFEVIIVEDGSKVSSEKVVESFKDLLNIFYFTKSNSGPGPSRNFGFTKANGDYFVVFDSDCVLPPQYFQAVADHFIAEPLDVWGGPDRGHPHFTPLQQAMAYSMSSVLTTGGIRGNKKQATSFQPRSFNMGISRQVFEATSGFHFDRYAEDIEFSIRSKKMGFRVGLIPEAYVFHKRRATLTEFFKQVMNFGRGRVQVGNAHPGEVKATHWLPAFFLLGWLAIPLLLLLNRSLGFTLSGLYVFYLLLVFVDASVRTKNFQVAFLAVPSAWVQLSGYGFGFLKAKLGG